MFRFTFSAAVRYIRKYGFNLLLYHGQFIPSLLF